MQTVSRAWSRALSERRHFPVIQGSAIAMVCAIVATLGACRGDESGVLGVVSPHDFYARLSLQTRTVNLATEAPYNTFQLQATGVLGDGATVPGNDVQFSTPDTAITVDSTGLITAKYVTAERAVVMVSLTSHGTTRRDSVLVNVAPTHLSPGIGSITIAPQAGDSAKMAIQSFFGLFQKPLVVKAYDSAGNPVSGLLMNFWSSDTSVATVDTLMDDTLVMVNGHNPGTAMIHVSVYAYGTIVHDSLLFTIGQPLFGSVSIGRRTPTGQREPVAYFDPGTVLIGVGGDILWLNFNFSNNPIDIVFDDPSAAKMSTFPFPVYAPDSGNVAPFTIETDSAGNQIGGYSGAARRFTTPGRYHYHSEVTGSSGLIIVCDDVTVPCVFPTETH